MSKILLVDNYDSFTFNLYQQLEGLGACVTVIKHDKLDIKLANAFDAIVISPGPKNPKDYPICYKIIKEFYQKKPIMGVCLGHQIICEFFGAKIVHAPKIMHGKISQINHSGRGLFKGVKQKFKACRYHSLVASFVPKDLKISAHTMYKNKKIIMAVSHKKFPLFGIQFHPESFLTEEGDKIAKNFLAQIKQINENKKD